ncbi:TRAP transporter large permease [Arenibaculum sp.]|jgi:tripartite ATP-independent transporter DctM subunit|uniref:TRAP transporter large permease n=1 Tax=Arenibaculum sp. TaxID=2865862 RepID=UPI002E0DD03A|nr:TRAP transporter large permease [Arenibaculum sp.]
MTALLLISLFVIFSALGLPLAFCMGITATAGLLFSGFGSPAVAAQRIFAGMNSYALLALPLFLLAGNILVAGGVINRLVVFADLLVGRVRGGLAQVNVLSNLMMAGVSGSATADTAALGSVMVPMMSARGYAPTFAAALTTSAGIVAPILPPSLIMVIYAIPTRISIGALFLAGVVPALLMSAAFMAYVRYACRHHPLSEKRESAQGLARATIHALPVLMAPVLLVGGIRGGVFTATEAAAVLVAYALALTMVLHRSLKLSELVGILHDSALTTASIMLMIGTSSIFAWYLAIEDVPQATRALLDAATDNRYVFLLIVNVFLLLVGCVLDTVPAILIFVPILQPAAVAFGIDPVHFAIIVIVNLMVGVNTPPIGTNLLVISGIAGLRVGSVTRALLPFYAVKVAALMVITYVPFISLWLPRYLGFGP